ncbi:FAD-NAD(P)-binding protein [Scandinavium lactucae]|uniref:FAD-NAD(P)-binding protein n=1 Tax=Scandinavium lactucae TaxID=3095028 RepID=A0ABU4QSV6_9ENTR|nr:MULTISPECIES: FAD-NAD(P)-binding protein [unclassified Scandinavium]MDX6042356.1 FAD-NAD(P)-binding protein [Scandinavium sp. V105_6]MDX6052357.1 FAD-NAD(P)-binding protein [Scandinavium sp. V105_1]
MKKIAIIGTGPTGIYTLFSILKNQTPVALSLYEQGDEAGVGMPYADEDNSRMMLANIASIEIPPIFSTYLEWLEDQPETHLARYGVEKASLHNRQFLPRILLGEFFRDQFLRLVARAKQHGFTLDVHESSEVTDLQVTPQGVRLWVSGEQAEEQFDLAVLATGHVWPDEEHFPRAFFPSPWSGLIEADIKAGNVGIMGLSLSAIDAAMAVVVQHGHFTETDDNVQFTLDKNSQALKISLLSRSGILPEADFYCPIPYEPLQVVTDPAIEREIAAGSAELLDRVFALIKQELELADPAWSEKVALRTLTADTFSAAWFADRKKHNPWHWVQANLREVERNKRDKHTVGWRYTILRLHEVVEEIVPHLTEHDRQRFTSGLGRVFIDNYTAIPSESIRRLMALREAGILSLHALGSDYTMDVQPGKTVISSEHGDFAFDTFIDARGQKALKIKDLPFPRFRQQLEAHGEDFPDIADDYTLLEPPSVRGRVAFAALPYLMHDRPFIQGITVCAEIGENIASAVSHPAAHSRRRLPFIEL